MGVTGSRKLPEWVLFTRTHSAPVRPPTSGADGTSGLFTALRPDKLRHAFIRIPWDGGKQLYVVEDERQWRNEILYSPLLRRYWVAQEFFLSSRVIFFTHEQIWWSCAALSMASNLHPNGRCSFPSSALPAMPLLRDNGGT